MLRSVDGEHVTLVADTEQAQELLQNQLQSSGLKVV